LTKKNVDKRSIISVVQPDLSIICDIDKLDQRGCLSSPDWIIAILSPRNTKKEMKEMYALYEENGVREYWIISPEHKFVKVYHFIIRKIYPK